MNQAGTQYNKNTNINNRALTPKIDKAAFVENFFYYSKVMLRVKIKDNEKTDLHESQKQN